MHAAKVAFSHCDKRVAYVPLPTLRAAAIKKTCKIFMTYYLRRISFAVDSSVFITSTVCCRSCSVELNL
ncbi:MAG: hypothetical protein K0S08_1525 [Gammaproteobacteria bacterium]|nr:hypothetical protein [Gammaproteobacteria bacterium]